MIERTTFASRLSDFVREELPATERREMEEYLAAHPEGRADLHDVEAALAVVDRLRATAPPESLLEEAKATVVGLLERDSPGRTLHLPGWVRRPDYLSGIAAILLLGVVALLWQATSNLTWAEVVDQVGQVHTLRVQGWIRGERGERLPVQQWLQVPHLFRAEIGTGADQRVVLADSIRRVILRRGEVVLAEPIPSDQVWTFARTVGRLRLPGTEELAARAYRIEREDAGQRVRFSIWPRSPLGVNSPADLRFEVEVDRDSRLPLRSRAFVDNGQVWVLVSELEYLDYDLPLDRALFRQPQQSPLGASPGEYWFERAMTPLVIWDQAVYLPMNGMEIAVRQPNPDFGKRGRGMTAQPGSGIERYEFHLQPLTEILRTLTSRATETADTVFALPTYWLHVAVSEALPWQERAVRLAARFGARVEVVERQGVRTRYLFTQNGTPFQVVPPLGTTRTNGTDYHAVGERLGWAIKAMFSNAAANSLVEGYARDTDTLEVRWNGPPEQNPFERSVDVEVEFSAGWSVAQDYLRSQFGVEMLRVREPIVYPVLRISR